MNLPQLKSVASKLVAKGLLAADEGLPSIEKRFRAIGLESTPETRGAWRELLLTTPELERQISGVILFDETLRQVLPDGKPLVSMLAARGIVPGIKVDRGTVALAGASNEKITEGLDGLGQRLFEYRGMGAAFTKWRAVLSIEDGLPSPYAIAANAHALARFAALSQANELVPIVEPEVLMDGAHSIERCAEVTEAVLREVFAELALQRVVLEGMLLKPSMVLSGKAAEKRANPERVAALTLQTMRRVVPAAVPGLVFLSGGQSDLEATENLDAINRGAANAPWQLSFSYGRALSATPLKTWAGRSANRAAAQAALLERAKAVGAAREGRYSAPTRR